MDITRLGQLLHLQRIERNITLRDVEKETGISVSTLSRLETAWTKKREISAPRTETVETLANWLGISLESLSQTRPISWSGILCDTQIIEAVSLYDMIDPFVDHKVQDSFSYGLNPFGYDIRAGANYILDGEHRAGSDIVIPSHSFALLESLEYFKIPPNVLCLVQGKSSYARTGLILNCTPGDPGWEGRWTLCAVNPTSSPITVRADQGIAQVIFFAGSLPKTPYRGKYQGDASLSPAKV